MLKLKCSHVSTTTISQISWHMMFEVEFQKLICSWEERQVEDQEGLWKKKIVKKAKKAESQVRTFLFCASSNSQRMKESTATLAIIIGKVDFGSFSMFITEV